MPKQYLFNVAAIAIALVSLSSPAALARGLVGGSCHGGGGGGGHVHFSHMHSGHYHSGGYGGGYGGGYSGSNYGATGGYLWGSGTGGGAYSYQSNEGRYNTEEDARRRALPDSAFVQNYNWPDSPQTNNGLASSQSLQAYNSYAGPGNYSAYLNSAVPIDPYSTMNQSMDYPSVQDVALPYAVNQTAKMIERARNK